MESNDATVIVLLALIGLLLVLGVLIFVLVRRQRAHQLGLVGGQANWQRSEFEDHEFLHSWQAAGRHQPSALIVALSCPSSATWRIRPEGDMERWFKRRGINREQQLGLPDFDAAFYLDSSTPELMRLTLDARRRAVVEKLFALGFNELELGGGWLRLVQSPAEEPQHALPEPVARARGLLAELARGLPAAAHTHTKSLPSSYASGLPGAAWGVARISAYVLAILPLLLMPVLMGLGMHHYPLLDHSLYWHAALAGVLLLVPFLWLEVLLLRGRAYSHVDLIAVAMLGLFSLPLSSVSLGHLLNAMLDDSQAQAQVALVNHSWREKSKDHSYFYLGLESWREAGAEERLEVDYNTFAAAEAGRSRIELRLHNGALGYPWVEGYALLDARARSSGR